MKPAFFIIGLLLIVLLCCKGPGREAVAKTSSGFDTVSNELAAYTELMPAGVDSAQYIEILKELISEKLKAHPGQATFDSSVLIKGYAGNLRYIQGNLFSKNKQHAIAQV